LKPVPAFCLLLASVLSASSALHAQPRAQDPPELPENWQNMYAHGLLSDEEKSGANPCPRPDRDPDPYMSLWPRRRGVKVALCVGRIKSSAFASAWASGLDVHGVKLEPDAGARKLAEMELWLRRLTGKFRIVGEYTNDGGNSQILGTANCFAVGSGPGVSCAISAKWKAPKEACKDPQLDTVLNIAVQPLVLLFGIDPVASQLRVTLVDFRAVTMQGFLVDDAVILDMRSRGRLLFNPLVTYHWLDSRVAMKPGGDVDLQLRVMGSDIRTTQCPLVPRPPVIYVEFDLKLQRETLVDAGVPRISP
jgi:hypothetical protein